jgi:hypothetical protein
VPTPTLPGITLSLIRWIPQSAFDVPCKNGTLTPAAWTHSLIFFEYCPARVASTKVAPIPKPCGTEGTPVSEQTARISISSSGAAEALRRSRKGVSHSWRLGYENASLETLMREMGILSGLPSLGVRRGRQGASRETMLRQDALLAGGCFTANEGDRGLDANTLRSEIRFAYA